MAKRQDRCEVEAILDYRAARMAVDLSKRPEGLDDYPELAGMLGEMRTAQGEAIEGT